MVVITYPSCEAPKKKLHDLGVMAHIGIEPMILATLAPRSDQLSS
jgi:hypothetical protein